MCGIAGFVSRGGVDGGSILDLVTSAFAHRGPDGKGIYLDKEAGVHFGHRRLSILDLEHGSQPMTTRDDAFVIVFNGEIYNNTELRSELERLGHVFSTSHSDTETVLIGFRQWGNAIFERLNGMFAIAVYDKAARKITLARDRCGEKPLFYGSSRGSFIFGSEVAPLFYHPHFPREIDPTGLQKYFAYGYVPAPHSLFKCFRKLEPGGILELDIDTGRLRHDQFYEFSLAGASVGPERSFPALKEELKDLLAKAVRVRLQADVPVGVMLSGGLDSSCVLAYATAAGGDALRTFTVGFEDAAFDESAYARIMVERYRPEHHEIRVSNHEMVARVDEILRLMDEPIVDPSIIPTYLLCDHAAKHVKVALSGDGGDELFAGYAPFKALAPSRLAAGLIPPTIASTMRRGMELLPRSKGYMSLDYKIRRFLQGIVYPMPYRVAAWMAPLDPELRREMFGEELPAEELYSEALAAWDAGGGNDVDGALCFFTRVYLPNNILTKSDRASMAVGLELRAIFLDPDLIEFCRHLPRHYKFSRGQGKILLREAMRDILPSEIVERRKQGFGIPLLDWLQSTMKDGLPKLPLEISARTAHTLWEGHMTAGRDERLFLFGAFALERALSRA